MRSAPLDEITELAVSEAAGEYSAEYPQSSSSTMTPTTTTTSSLCSETPSGSQHFPFPIQGLDPDFQIHLATSAVDCLATSC